MAEDFFVIFPCLRSHTRGQISNSKQQTTVEYSTSHGGLDRLRVRTRVQFKVRVRVREWNRAVRVRMRMNSNLGQLSQAVPQLGNDKNVNRRLRRNISKCQTLEGYICMHVDKTKTKE
jgi:hypothetical protein